MKLIVYCAVFIILGLWIYLRKKKMAREKIQLETWLVEQGLIRYQEDTSDLLSFFRGNQWVLCPGSIYDVIPVQRGSVTFYLFSADIKKSDRVFRTYGSIFFSVPFYGSFLLMSGSSDDLKEVIERSRMKEITGADTLSLLDGYSLYSGSGTDTREILRIIEPVILTSGIGDLMLEMRNGKMLILRDEYFTPDDIAAAVRLAKALLTAMNPDRQRDPDR